MATIDEYKIKIDVVGGEAIKATTAALSGLGSVVAGLGLAAFGASILKLADDMSDLADAVGLSMGQVTAYSQAVQQAGGNFDDAGKSIIKFYKGINDAATGSASAQEALKKVGITLTDIKTLSEGQLLAKAIEGLSDMEAGAQRTATQVELFGKSFGNIDPDALKKMLNTTDVESFAQGLQDVKDVNDNLQASMLKLQILAAQTFGPFIKYLSEIKINWEAMIPLVKLVASVTAAIFAANVVASIIAFVKAIELASIAFRAMAIAEAVALSLSGPAGWAVLAAGALAAAGAIYGINKALDANAVKAKASKSAMDSLKTPTGGGGAIPNATGVASKSSEQLAKEAQARVQAVVGAKEVTKQLQLQNAEANKMRELNISLIGQSSTYATLIKSNAEARSQGLKDIAVLEGKIREEQAKGKDANAGVVMELQKQIESKNAQVAITEKLNQREADRTIELQKQKDLINNTIQLQADAITFQLEYDRQKTQQLVVNGQITQDTADIQMRLHAKELAHLQEAMALEQQMAVAVMANDEAEKANITEKKRLEQLRYDTQIGLMKDAFNLEIDMRNSSVAGQVAAIEQLRKGMTPFNMAQEATIGFFNQMNSAIDNFVMTGKFKFGDFVKQFIAGLIAMQLKAAAFKMFSFLMPGLKLPGFAEGGQVGGNAPIIVGEKGPELFVPKSAGEIIPNNKLNASSGGSATPAGVSSTQNTYITNNINAVDAKSVAQLFVENRKLLLGATNMAKKEMPYAS